VNTCSAGLTGTGHRPVSFTALYAQTSAG